MYRRSKPRAIPCSTTARASGGGSPYLALLNMRQLYRKGVVCRLMEASELADDDLVAVVSNMGAPLVGQERLMDP